MQYALSQAGFQTLGFEIQSNFFEAIEATRATNKVDNSIKYNKDSGCVDKSRSKKLGGTGLGLSIVKHGAKYHDAKISVHSEVGSGSVFELRF